MRRHVASSFPMEQAAVIRNPRELNGGEVRGGARIVRCFSFSHIVQLRCSAPLAVRLFEGEEEGMERREDAGRRRTRTLHRSNMRDKKRRQITQLAFPTAFEERAAN